MITNSQLQIMSYLWHYGPSTASELVEAMKISKDWNKSTTYSVIYRSVDAGIIRRERGFLCIPLVTRTSAGREMLLSVVLNYFNGSIEEAIRCLEQCIEVVNE